MTAPEVNNDHLRDFVHYHKLMDHLSYIHFSGIVFIETAQKSFSGTVDARITLDGHQYGEIVISHPDIDPYPQIYPTVFRALWQTIRHTDHSWLEISDVHKQNPVIGKYLIKLFPGKRYRD